MLKEPPAAAPLGFRHSKDAEFAFSRGQVGQQVGHLSFIVTN